MHINHLGDVMFHARDAFFSASNRITAEFRAFIWVIRSCLDLHLDNLIFVSDCSFLIEALNRLHLWPKYRLFINKIGRLLSGFCSASFHFATPKASSVARKITSSVTGGGPLHSYLAMMGPSWLHSQLEAERLA